MKNIDITLQMVAAVRQASAACKPALETMQRDWAGEIMKSRICKKTTNDFKS